MAFLRFLGPVWSAWALVWMAVITAIGSLTAYVLGSTPLKHHQLRWIPRWWAKSLMAGAGCPVGVRGLEVLEPGAGYVFAVNHSSALDIPALQSFLPTNFRWAAKKELFEIPVFGPALAKVGDIPIDRGAGRQAMASLLSMAQRISDGTSIVIFPEGTRTNDGELLPFKAGGFLLAIKAARPVVPIYLSGTFQALPPHVFRLKPGRVTAYMGQPIPTEGLKSGDREELAEQVRQALLALKARAEAER